MIGSSLVQSIVARFNKLADTTSLATGAGMVGFNTLRNYGATTLGGWLNYLYAAADGVGISVPTIAALKLHHASGITKASVGGNAAQGDGADRSYYYDSTDTTSPDDGLTILVSADGGRWKTTAGNIGPTLAASEGVTYANGYMSAHLGNLTVPLNNAGNVRYWTANYTLTVPPGATIPSGDVRHDHVSVSGHSRSQSVNSRIWGAVGLAQLDAACTTNAQVGQCYGGEFDVNNNSGYDVTNFSGDGDIAAQMLATGGSSVAKAAQIVSAVGTSKFYTCRWVRSTCLHSTGFVDYIDNVSPAHGYYFSDVYGGGDAMSVPPQKAVVFRTTAGGPATIQSLGTALQINSGTGGINIANNANTVTNFQFTDAGVLAVGVAASAEKFKVQADNTGTSRSLMLLNGAGGIQAYTDFGNTTSSAGENAAHATVYLRKDATTNRSINAAGTINASGTDYAEYMLKADGCGELAKGAIVGVTAAGTITDKWAEAVSFVIKSTDPSFVGGDTWGAEDALGHEAPAAPVLILPAYAGTSAPGTGPSMPTAPRAPKPDEDGNVDQVAADRFEAAYSAYLADVAALPDAIAAHQVLADQYEADQAAHAALEKAARDEFDSVTMPAYEAARDAFDAVHNAERARWDRIAYAGQVPVNVQGAKPGQLIVAVQAGEGIAGAAIDADTATLTQYIKAVGLVQNILEDGRANVRVKVA